jgi:hypothetical protein
MSDLDTLKKIIPPDQAVANKALARGLQQVKQIFDTDISELAPRLAQVEGVTDLPLVNGLTQVVPTSVQDYFADTFGTGTGPGNTITTSDVIGVAAGSTINLALPAVTSELNTLTNLGAFTALTANGGTASSSINGIYTVMSYCLAGDYTTAVETDPGPPPVFSYTVTIPSPLPAAGTYGPSGDLSQVLSDAFNVLIPLANSVINNTVSTYSSVTSELNTQYLAAANQLSLNVVNCVKADIDIANVTFDISNANLISNATSSLLNFASSLHDFALDTAPGGTAEFLDQVANLDNLTGQSVVASLREGRNIQRLNQVGILLDTQLPSIPPISQ